MEPTLDIQPISWANLTVAERELFASYVAHNSIASHQREAEQGRIASFARLLAAYSELDTYLAEAQGEFEELSRALEAATSRATKAESRAEGLQAELAEQEKAALGWAEEINTLKQLLSMSESAQCEAAPASLDGVWDSLNAAKEYFAKVAPGYHHWVPLADIGIALAAYQVQFDSQAAPTPPPSSPAAAGPGCTHAIRHRFTQACMTCGQMGEPTTETLSECQSEFGPCQEHCGQCKAGPADPWRAIFPTEADYDASVADVCRRIESGEITPRQVELNSLHRCPLCDESPCGMCPEHAGRLAPTTTGEGKEGES